MPDKNLIYIIKSSRGGYIQRVAILNDRDKRLFPFVLAYETKNKRDALKFDYDVSAQCLADLLTETKEESYSVEPLIL